MGDKAAALTTMREARTFVLPKSKVTVIYDADPSVSQIIAAQKAAGKETSLFVLYLAQATATFNDERWTMGEIREKIRGKDYLVLAAEMLGDDKGDEAEASSGN
jgi:hypothetical protein